MKNVLPWTITILAVALAGYQLSQPAKIQIQEGVKERIVEKPVEVVKQVPVPLTAEQKMKIDSYDELMNPIVMPDLDLALVGIKSANVAVFFDKEIGSAWSRESLQTQAELQLRRDGIIVKNLSEGPNATVEIACNSLKNESGVTSYCLELNVMVNETILRWDFKYIRLDVPLWKCGTIGYFGSEKKQEAANAAIQYVLNKFSNAYLKANPIKRE